MDEHRINQLANKFLIGTITDAELKQLEDWFAADDNIPLEVATDSDENNLQYRIFSKIAERGNLQSEKTNTRRSFWPLISAVASILLFVSVGIYFIRHQNTSEEAWTAQNFKNDVVPGHNQARLTLGNGQVIALNTKPKGSLAIQGNINITKTANGEIHYQAFDGNDNEVMVNTLSTQRKEEFKVTLSDGTHVWLNAESSIRYPTLFTGKDREVVVTGEAYFEVAHNREKPFRVIADNVTVEVLGTHFNINAYPNEPVLRTTLLEGSVRVSVKNSFEIIKPGEQATLNKGQLSITDANTEEAVAWKNGYFRFNKEHIENIMRELSRWYDVDVHFEGPIPEEIYSGKISRYRNISEILKVFEYSGSIHFKIEGRRVTVLK